MANWLLVIDEDGSRRAGYAARVRTLVAPIAGLRVQSREGAGWSAVWAAASTAPVDVEVGSNGAALLWGEARDAAGGLQTAAAVRAAWRGGAVAQWDGYYAAAVVEEPGQTLTVGTDVLGVFPIYYWTDSSGVVLVGTSPELFRTHPRFRPALNETGLVGILLSNGLVDGQTLWRGVRRLGPGCRLRVLDGRVWEDEGYRLPLSTGAVDLPLEGHVCQLAEVVEAAVKRHAPLGRSYGLLLSGGLDSRMIAGFLIRADVRPRALTLGLPSDLEMRCAKAVAELYGLEHVTTEPDATDYPSLAGLQARWEHLANGFNTVRDWWTQGRVAQLGDRLVTGGLADSLVGATSMSWAYSENPPAMSYGAFVKQMPRLGVPGTVLRQLLDQTRFAGLVDDVERRLRDEFHGYGERISYCAWRYDLAHGQRYHVGSTAWRLSFGAWPVLPMLDRQVIETAANIPASSMANREAQISLVRTRLPELASVPLDRSDLLSHEPQYLTPRLRQLIANSVRRRLRAARQNLGFLMRDREARYWHRINNFDGDAWKAAREAAEPQRPTVADLFDSNLLRTILPPPRERGKTTGPWVGESGRKLLLGLLYWSKDHLSDDRREAAKETKRGELAVGN
jgi:asparagine synthase (glutamine-hydrolysing)